MAGPLVVSLVIELDDEAVGACWTEEHLAAAKDRSEVLLRSCRSIRRRDCGDAGGGEGTSRVGENRQCMRSNGQSVATCRTWRKMWADKPSPEISSCKILNRRIGWLESSDTD